MTLSDQMLMRDISLDIDESRSMVSSRKGSFSNISRVDEKEEDDDVKDDDKPADQKTKDSKSVPSPSEHWRFALIVQNYVQTSHVELSVTNGQVLEVLERKPSSTSWLLSGLGKFGLVPTTCFKHIPEEEAVEILRSLQIKSDDLALDEEEDDAENESDEDEKETEFNPEELTALLTKCREDVAKSSVPESVIEVESKDSTKLKCGYCHCELDPHNFYELNNIICCKEDLLKNVLKCRVSKTSITGEHIILQKFGRIHF
eukprot:TRINITY_DN10709_c0_g1_i3.p1 TRINITY_DN10709_c0_g1~~TRINITY_DN10709_c0_g1_i3.p1  ORF type:complete len:259 (-),score=69.53 TRINITY_DN10709_c0_g1_i3:1252-2028(-)